MIAIIGNGGKRPHFAHDNGTSCNSETYLHKLAKIRIRHHFFYSEGFPIIFKRDIPCKEQSRCPFYEDYQCKKDGEEIVRDLKLWERKEIFNNCEEEKPYDGFVPDLLLTNPEKNYEPVFIEIFKTHASSEKKTESKYRIIETKKIQSENDIDDIIKRGFIEGENCKTYNFQLRNLPDVRRYDIPISRFVLFKNGAAKVYSAVNYLVHCDYAFKKYHKDSIAELNLRGHSVDIWGTDTLNSYQAGLVYLRKKGYPIRNCILCDLYRFNDFHKRFICIMYRKHGHIVPPSTQINAIKCPDYRENQRLTNYPDEELNKLISELPEEA